MEYKGYQIKMIEPVLHEYEFEEDKYGNPTNEHEVDAYPSNAQEIYFDVSDINGRYMAGSFTHLAIAKIYIESLKEAA